MRFLNMLLRRTRDVHASDDIKSFDDVLADPAPDCGAYEEFTLPFEPPCREREKVFRQAVCYRELGDLDTAGELLLTSCEPPSSYVSHYRELFSTWRELNARDAARGHFEAVSQRVCTMIRMDDEMVAEVRLRAAHSAAQIMPRDLFDRYRNLQIVDLQLLVESANALGDEELAVLALEAMRRYSANWDVDVVVL
jgi:hypothetical protein